MSLIFGYIDKSGKPADEPVLDKVMQSVSRPKPIEYTSWTRTGITLANTDVVTDTIPGLEHLIITADVRLDNRHDLASILKVDAIRLNDARLILLAFHRWGKKCVDHLEGEFAFAIWNNDKHELFAATDPVGFRPFYFYDTSDVFIFCSDIKGITAIKATPDTFNEEALIDYYLRSASPCHTYNQEVFLLDNASSLLLKNGKISIEKYWALQPTGKYKFKEDKDWYDCLLELLYKAVDKRLNYESPAGLTLSGGLDSSCLAAILSDLLQKKNKPLYTFSSVLPSEHQGIENDERQYIESISRYYPNIIQTYVVAPESESANLIIESFLTDQCFPNTFHYLDKALLKEAREKNIKTLFTGYGGDSGISWKGDTVIYQLIKNGKFKDVYQLLREFRNQENRSLFYLLLKKYLPHTELIRHLRPLLKKKKINWQYKTMLKDSFIEKHKNLNISQPLNDFTVKTQNTINQGRIASMLSMLHNRNAAYSMGSAVPFFDKSILEFLMDIPRTFFIKGGIPRSLMRSLMKGKVPEEISNRKDKLPYSPGYENIIKRQKPLFETILHSENYDFVFDKYIDKKIIIDHFNDIKPEKAITSSENIVAIRIKQAAIAAVIMRHLKEENYTF